MTEESSRLTSSSSEFSRQTTSSSSNLSGVRAEESSLYVDVLIPRFNSEKSLPLAASLLERPGSGVIRCRSTQGLQGPTGTYSGLFGHGEVVEWNRELSRHANTCFLKGRLFNITLFYPNFLKIYIFFLP